MDFGRETAVFPLVPIQEKRVAKRAVLGLKNKRKMAFLPFKRQFFYFQAVRYAASGNKYSASKNTFKFLVYCYSKLDLLRYLVHTSFACFFHIFRFKHSQAQYTQKHERCLYHSVIFWYIESMCHVITNIVSFSSEHIFKKINIFFFEYL